MTPAIELARSVEQATIREEAQRELQACTDRRAALGLCDMSAPLGRPRVLVVEDEERMAGLYERWINDLELGAVVIREVTLESGLRAFSYPFEIRAVIADWRLPERKNARPIVDTCRRLGIQVIVVTGADPGDVDDVGGDVEVLQKPIDAPRRAALETFLRKALAGTAVTQPVRFDELEGAVCPKCGRRRRIVSSSVIRGYIESASYLACSSCEPGRDPIHVVYDPPVRAPEIP